VWAALADGWSYHHWVVGTRMIREVDDGFPGRGTALHYRIGRGPLRHDGHTEVLDVDEGHRLVLEIHAWPVGAVRVDIRLDDDAGDCEVTMEEFPSKGVGGVLHNPLADGLIKLRNVETLRRLDRLAVDRVRRDAAIPKPAPGQR